MSDLCDEYKIQPSVFYKWQKALLENIELALDGDRARDRSSKRDAELERKVEALESKLAKKDGVIAEISEQYVALKKEFGEP